MFQCPVVVQIWDAQVESHTATEWIVHNVYYDQDLPVGQPFEIEFVASAPGYEPADVTFYFSGKCSFIKHTSSKTHTETKTNDKDMCTCSLRLNTPHTILLNINFYIAYMYEYK